SHPRRDATFRIRFLHQPTWSPAPVWWACDFTVPNFHPDHYSQWVPGSVPQKMAAGGGITATLKRFVTRVREQGWLGFRSYPLTFADFLVEEDGRPAPEWKAMEWTLEDATGNRFEPGDTSDALPPPGQVRLWLGGRLSGQEAAYRLKVVLART